MAKVIEITVTENGFIVNEQEDADPEMMHVVVKQEFTQTATALYRAVLNIIDRKEA